MNQTPQQEKVAAANAAALGAAYGAQPSSVAPSISPSGTTAAVGSVPAQGAAPQSTGSLERLQVRPLQQRPAIPAQQIRRLISQRIIRSLTQELNSILRPLNKTFLSRLRVQGLRNK